MRSQETNPLVSERTSVRCSRLKFVQPPSESFELPDDRRLLRISGSGGCIGSSYRPLRIASPPPTDRRTTAPIWVARQAISQARGVANLRASHAQRPSPEIAPLAPGSSRRMSADADGEVAFERRLGPAWIARKQVLGAEADQELGLGRGAECVEPAARAAPSTAVTSTWAVRSWRPT
jgi:hypothetical protein